MKRQALLLVSLALVAALVVAHRVQTARQASRPVAGVEPFQGRWALMSQPANGPAVATGITPPPMAAV